MRATIVFLLFVSAVFSEDCTLDVSDSESPFVVDANYKFPKYDAGKDFSITFGQEKLFYVVCPKGTQSPYIGEKGDHVDCKGGTSLLNIRTKELIDFANIKCKHSPATTVTKLEEKCAYNGTLFKIGFDIFKKFAPEITICFDEEKLNPIYSKHDNLFYGYSPARALKTLRESNDLYQKYGCSGADCGWADSGNVYSSLDMDFLFESQTKTLVNYAMDNVDSELLKISLTTNSIVFLNDVENGQQVRKAPYFDYINVVPVWDLGTTINDLVDMFKESATNKNKMGRTTFTGTLGVLTLPDKDGNEVEVYLNGNQVPVPKWLWIVLDESKEIIFYYNHPTSEKKDVEEKIAELCSEYDPATNSNTYTCKFASVIDEKMKYLIKNDF